MGVFRSVGKGIGTVGGGVLGGSVRLIGKAVGTKYQDAGKWIEDVGDATQKASVIALDNAGQFVDGAVKGTYGLIKDDAYYKQTGLSDLKDSNGRTIKGIGSTITYTAANAGETFRGFSQGDKEQAINGLKNLGKVVAVSSLAIGVLDVIDGADGVEAAELDTRNQDLGGDIHPETGVPFEAKYIDLRNGQVVEGTFPVFDSTYHVQLSEELYLESDDVHFAVANDNLYQALQADPSLAKEIGLSQTDIQSLAYGETPDNFVWHHSEEPGILQLVDKETHEQTGHTGGRTIWGGGSEYR